MVKAVLATNPSHDKVTQYFSAWLSTIIDTPPKDVRVYELKGDMANKDNLERILKNHNPSLVLFNGHGDKYSIDGYKDTVLIECGPQLSILKDKIIHALACEAGLELGPESIKIGSKAFIGYKNKFIFFDSGGESKEEKLADDYASFCLRPAFAAVSKLVAGATAEEAHEESIKLYKQNLLKLIGSKTTELQETAGSVYHNLKNLVLLGDKSAKI